MRTIFDSEVKVFQQQQQNLRVFADFGHAHRTPVHFDGTIFGVSLFCSPTFRLKVSHELEQLGTQ